MTGLMQGKRGLIMGVANDHSIAWGIAKSLAAQGAQLAFTYQGDALRKRVEPLANSVGSSLLVPCDVEDVASVDGVFATLAREWGKIDFLVNEQPYLDGYFGVVFATLYAKYGLAPVGPVATGPSIVDKTNIDKILHVFDTYPNVIGSK